MSRSRTLHEHQLRCPSVRSTRAITVLRSIVLVTKKRERVLSFPYTFLTSDSAPVSCLQCAAAAASKTCVRLPSESCPRLSATDVGGLRLHRVSFGSFWKDTVQMLFLHDSAAYAQYASHELARLRQIATADGAGAKRHGGVARTSTAGRQRLWWRGVGRHLANRRRPPLQGQAFCHGVASESLCWHALYLLRCCVHVSCAHMRAENQPQPMIHAALKAPAESSAAAALRSEHICCRAQVSPDRFTHVM